MTVLLLFALWLGIAFASGFIFGRIAAFRNAPAEELHDAYHAALERDRIRQFGHEETPWLS